MINNAYAYILPKKSGRKVFMASLLNKMLDFVGWETEEVEDDYYDDEEDVYEAERNETVNLYMAKRITVKFSI